MDFQKTFEALSDPTRREILSLLKKGRKSVNELGENFSIKGSSLTHHLNKLKNANLVYTKREGQQIFYYLHVSVFEDVAKHVGDFFKIGVKK